MAGTLLLAVLALPGVLAARPSAEGARAATAADPEPAPGVPAPELDYRVEAGPGGRVLSIEARFGPGHGERFVLDRGLARFVDDAEHDAAGAWRPARRKGDALEAPGCSRGCAMRYRLRLADAARALQDRTRAFAHGAAYLAPPSSWLAHPAGGGLRGRYRLRVAVPADVSFVTGVYPSPAEAGAWEARGVDLPEAPWSGFGAFETRRVEAAGAAIELAVAPGARAVNLAVLERWVARSAAAVGAYFGRFPVPRALVIVLPGGRRPVGFGTALGNGGASIMVWLGARAVEDDLRRDWVLVHEMVHLGFPNVARRHRWIEEGLATYVEPVARARAGLVPPEDVWLSFRRGMPRSLADVELDLSRARRSVYWGGAAFALEADVAIRERTSNRVGLDDALKGIVAAGGTIATSWPLERVLAVGDAATGVPVLQELYASLRRGNPAGDLEALWSRLGVGSGPVGLVLDPAAPLAYVRRAIAGERDAGPAPQRP